MSLSPNVCILTREELENIKDDFFRDGESFAMKKLEDHIKHLDEELERRADAIDMLKGTIAGLI